MSIVSDRSVWGRMRAEWRGNRRLQIGLLLILAVLLIEGGLRWNASLHAKQQVLSQLESDLALLRSNAQDESGLRRSLDAANQTQEVIKARMWTVTSEATGQARLKDWLTGVVKAAIADQYAINVQPSRRLGPPEAQSATVPESELREFRATVQFRMTPQALEGVLYDIEAGKPFSTVETLSVKAVERRVELTIRVLMQIEADGHD